MGQLDIGVVGCGYAGGAAGLLLARAGHRVVVYERVQSPKPIGAGILLQPSGMQVLSELGLVSQVLSRGAMVPSLGARTDQGKQLLELRYGQLNSGYFGVGLHRGVLFETLYDALVLEPSSRVCCGVEIVRAEEDAEGRLVLLDDRGEHHGPHDLLIVADGAHSQIQIPQAPERRVTPYPWGALWALLEDPDQVLGPGLQQVVRGTTNMVGFLPTGTGPLSSGGTAELLSLFWSVRLDRVDDVQEEGLARWKRRVLELEPRAEPLLTQLTDMSQLIVARYQDVRMSTYHSGRTVFLGDAAHAMSPQLGQGANLALYDAWVLAQCVAAHPSEPPRALQQYSRRRRAHLAYYQWANRTLTPFFQSDSRLRGWLRDAFLGPVSALPPFRRRMVATMAGIQTGVFGAPLALRSLPERSAVGVGSGGR